MTIPKKSTQREFNRWAASPSGFNKIARHLSNDIVDEKGVPQAISLIANYMKTRYPTVFEDVGLISPKRMTAIETAAMISDASVSSNAVIIYSYVNTFYLILRSN